MILITGANGNLGRRLLRELSARGAATRAVVRSERAAGQIRDLQLERVPEVVVLDYLDTAAMLGAATDCSRIVHLVGIIKETADNDYTAAHEGTSRVLADVAVRSGVEQLLYLSIVATSETSANTCLASKARAERILLDCPVPAYILRVPMVLGEGDYASGALRARAQRGVNVLVRGASLEQPIYAGDVVAAILAVLAQYPVKRELDLAGPRCLSRAALTHAAAEIRGCKTRVVSLPLRAGMIAAWLMEHISANPPITRAMLDVLDHDDNVDAVSAAKELGIELTDLEVALARCVADD